ncbi:Imm58 family immunity protein [Citrobacter freundii]|uniref:Imm58 family immunity protein n=1 Tax=Citrobacter freundii TaxID=546 RepID=UPI000B42178D|nr:immunity protein 58 [Citrobacter freundii]
MKFKVTLIIIFFSTFINIYLSYNWIDRSITLSYSKQSMEDCSNDLLLLTQIIKGELKGKKSKYIRQQFIDNGLDEYLLIKKIQCISAILSLYLMMIY